MTLLTIEFTAITCFRCACVFGIEKAMNDRLGDTHETFYCPNGHAQRYGGESTTEKLRKQLVARQAELDQARAYAADSQRQAEKARHTAAALKKRIGNGVCPCCSRSFTNLRQHMATKHPEHASHAEVAAAKNRSKKP